MDQRPIGVFDSGLGGLTALRELTRIMPDEDLVYFGDTGRVPYGSRSPETIIRYAQQDVAFLNTFQPKAIVIACGTVSTTALDVLQREWAIPIFGVVEPAARAAAQLTRNGKIGLIGTDASIRSGAYERALAALSPNVNISTQACPLFVPLVENGRYQPGDIVAETVVAEYLEPLKNSQVDTLMLGCTHYPLLRPIIAQYMGEDVSLVDVGEQCARWVAAQLTARGLRSESGKTGTRRFFVSDTPGNFCRLASIFLGEDVTDHVERIDITRY